MQESLKNMLELVKEISVSIDNPYIDFYFIKATPALVLCVVYIILLAISDCVITSEHADYLRKKYLWR